MVFKIFQNQKLIGFTYYPVIEIALGIFFIFMAFFVPLLFFKYNGFKTEQWIEWLFLAIFLIFFLFLGSNLAYQNMQIEAKNDTLYMRQDMRLPELKLEVNLSDWNGVFLDTKEEDNKKKFLINIKKGEEVLNFYQTTQSSEATRIFDLINFIYLNIKGVNDGKE